MATPNNQTFENLYFIGIGGIGMSGLAEMALAKGLRVKGSDINPSENTKRLKNLGAEIFDRHDASQVSGCDLVIYSSAINDKNPEIQRCQNEAIPLWHRSKLLHYFCKDTTSICVTGTHGKTTTSALIAHMLEAMHEQPSYIIGGILNNTGSPTRLGHSKLFVAEVDESDGSFQIFHPYISVVTNIEADHMEYYETLENMTAAYANYMSQTDEDGQLIVGWDNKLISEVSEPFRERRLAYGVKIGCDVRAINIKFEGKTTRFTAVLERQLIECSIPLIGKHNVVNALCALSVAKALELDLTKACKALESFAGVKRRMSLVFENAKISIYDDYAHNPGKIAAAVGCLKNSFPNKKLYVAFQPHRYSRLDTMYEEMLACLEDSDHLYILPVFSAGESTDKDFSPTRLAKDFKARYHPNVFACENLEFAAQMIYNDCNDNEAIVVTIGAGDIYKVGQMLKNLFG